MAGRKITQLPTLTTPAATDKLVIVDVSDTSESPQGTSKQIAFENLGITSIESDSLNVTIDGGVATVEGISGTWTPTVVNQTGTATIDLRKFHYQQVGNTVSIFGYFSVSLPGDETFTNIDIDLPIDPASDFADGDQVSGVCKIRNDYNLGGQIIASSLAASKLIRLEIGALAGESFFCYFSLAYSL